MRKSMWISGFVISLIVIPVAIFFTLIQPEPLPENSQSQALLQAGPYVVETLNIELTDNTRTTQANNEFEGSPNRKLASTIWYPKLDDNTPKALIIHSHGYSSMRLGGEYLAEHLASYGFVVIAADFPLTNYNAPGGPMVRDVVNQAADVSFLINSALQFNRDQSHPLFNLIDKRRIGLLGISLGGMTTTMATFDPHRRDPRIKAAISIGGPTAMFGAPYFSHAKVPFLMIASNIDALVNYEDNALPVLDRIHGSMLITLKGASHTGWAKTGRLLQWMNNPDALGCYVVMQNLNANEEPWYHLIGSEEDGIIDNIDPKLCLWDPLPKAMNPVEQQRLTILAVTSFMQAHLADQAQTKALYGGYLLNTFAKELRNVSIQRAATHTTH
jgi:predicted dienelactone hydrolase